MDNDKFQELIIEKFEEQDKKQDRFQELVIKQFGEINTQFGKVFKKLEDHDAQFDKVFKKLDRLEELANQHHEELEIVARQVETHEKKAISKTKFYLVEAPE